MPEPYRGPAVGKMAPAFKLPASDGQTISLSDFKGRQNVVLYFYPKADTPGCTKEACGFRDAVLRREYDDVAFVLGISPDPIEKVRKFASKFNLHFLLADEDHAVAERYGVWVEKSMYGRKYWGAARTTFVIGKDGKILHIFEKVKPEGHDREVLAWLQKHT